MPHLHVLIVEDDMTYRNALEKHLRHRFSVGSASTVRQAMQCLQSQRFHIALIDLNLPDGHGFDLMKMVRKRQPHLVMIVITGQGTVETAVKAIQRGAFHYLMKPFSMERLDHLIHEALKHVSVAKAHEDYALNSKFRFDGIVGSSPAMMSLFKLVEKVSTSDSNILIRGESGTGKELIARAIHLNSDRHQKPFIAVNCGALPEGLLESELFGHVKGAFTGALYARKGRFELAHEGTIFLDEVGDMSPRLQVKLLRVLQERKFEPVGMSQSVSIDARIIAATHQNLEKAVRERRFREDLYYRLNVIPIVIPPLRERVEDIPSLIQHFLEKFNVEKKKNVTGFSTETINALCRYAWPGNVRELENLVERLVILKGEGEITAQALADKYFSSPSDDRHEWHVLPREGIDLGRAVGRFEENLILQAINRTGGNRNKAARLLRLKRTTLVEKLKRLKK